MDAVTRTAIGAASQNAQNAAEARMWKAAQDLEATFLSEMLKSAGLGEVSEFGGGGIGEEQFASFLRDEHAKQMVQAGGIGLAQSIFEAMKDTANGTL